MFHHYLPTYLGSIFHKLWSKLVDRTDRRYEFNFIRYSKLCHHFIIKTSVLIPNKNVLILFVWLIMYDSNYCHQNSRHDRFAGPSKFAHLGTNLKSNLVNGVRLGFQKIRVWQVEVSKC